MKSFFKIKFYFLNKISTIIINLLLKILFIFKKYFLIGILIWKIKFFLFIKIKIIFFFIFLFFKLKYSYL